MARLDQVQSERTNDSLFRALADTACACTYVCTNDSTYTLHRVLKTWTQVVRSIDESYNLSEVTQRTRARRDDMVIDQACFSFCSYVLYFMETFLFHGIL